MADRTRRISLVLRSDLLDDAAEAARERGLSLAAFVRTALLDKMEADAITPKTTISRQGRLSAADVLKLDKTLRELGVDMAALCREPE